MIDRLPESIECEKSVLGAVLLDNACMDEAAETLTADEFHFDAHRRIYRAMLTLRDEQLPIDLAMLQTKLRARGEFEKIGGATYIAGLIDGVPRTDTIEFYTSVIKKKAQVRMLMKAASQIAMLCVDDPDSPSLIADCQRIFWEACESHTSNGFRSIGDLAHEYLLAIEAMGEAKGGITGLRTGFQDFDFRTLGLQRKELTVLAGRPSTGKTTFSFNIADHVARAGNSVAYFSLEMTDSMIAEKAISSDAQIDSFVMRAGALSRDAWVKAAAAAAGMEGLKLHVCDEPKLTTSQIRAKAQRYKREHGLDLIVVDFLQLIGGVASKREQARNEIVGQNAIELKAIAKELDCSVIALCQLSREIEKRSDPRPVMSDLGESGKIEWAADVITFIYTRQDEPDNNQVAHIFIGKNRTGPKGEFNLSYLKAQNRLESMARDY